MVGICSMHVYLQVQTLSKKLRLIQLSLNISAFLFYGYTHK